MSGQELPALTTDQMVEVDRLMIEEYGIALIQMMENAGRNLATLTRRLLGGRVAGKRIEALCGLGNNGGGGLVAARHLSNWGAHVGVTLASDPDRLKEVPAHQWNALAELPVERRPFDPSAPPDLQQSDAILDALIGYGLQGDPREPIATLIRLANQAGSKSPIVALDAPSGLDTTTGSPASPCIQATATLTLALPKTGLLTDQARPVVGALYLADISVPPSLYARLGLDVPPIFDRDTLLRLGPDGSVLDRE